MATAMDMAAGIQTALDMASGVPSAPKAEKSGAAQCCVTPAQMDELFQKLDFRHRREFGEWSKKKHLPFFIVPKDEEGRPTQWFLRTLDTGRFVRFAWSEVTYRIFPEAGASPPPTNCTRTPRIADIFNRCIQASNGCGPACESVTVILNCKNYSRLAPP